MKKEIEEIKSFEAKVTYSNFSKNHHNIFKTTGVESLIKRYEEEEKIKKNRRLIKKITVSEYLDQLCKEKGVSFYKQNTQNTKSVNSFVTKFIKNNHNHEIDIFSKQYSPQHYIKQNLIRVKEKNKQQKEKSKSLLQKIKENYQFPPLGKYIVNDKIIRKHTPAYSFSNTIYQKGRFKSISPIRNKSNKDNTIFKRINSSNCEKEREKVKDIKDYIIKQNFNFKLKKNKIRKIQSQIDITNEENSLFTTLLNNRNKNKKKKKSFIFNSITTNITKNNRLSSDVFLRKIQLIDNKKINIKPYKIKKMTFRSNILSGCRTASNSKGSFCLSPFSFQFSTIDNN